MHLRGKITPGCDVLLHIERRAALSNFRPDFSKIEFRFESRLKFMNVYSLLSWDILPHETHREIL